MSAQRNQEAAIDLARRAIEAAKRRQDENGPPPDEIAERLRAAADGNGNLTVDAAVEALTKSGATDPLADWRTRREKRERAAHERFFGPEPESAEPSVSPQGSTDELEANDPKEND